MQNKISLLLLISLLSFSACKKGEDDPFISIYSREKRIIGEWKVSEGEIRYKNPPYNAYYHNYNNGKIEINFSDDYYNYISKGTYYWYFSIKKDGKYSISKTITITNGTSRVSMEEGFWYFLNKNKNNEYKNKECIAFQPTKYTYQNVVNYESENRNPYVYLITELRNKKIVLKSNYSYIHNHPSDEYTEYQDEIITMIPEDQDF